MSAVTLLLIMVMSFHHVLSKRDIYDSQKETFSGVYKTSTKQCETQWGKVKVGEVIHRFPYHGSTILKCVEGGFKIDQRTSYVKMYGTRIGATNTNTPTKCGIFRYTATVRQMKEKVVIHFIIKKGYSSPSVCTLHKFEDCFTIGITRQEGCTYYRCEEWFGGVTKRQYKGCILDGVCRNPGYQKHIGWFWWEKKCVCHRNGMYECFGLHG